MRVIRGLSKTIFKQRISMTADFSIRNYVCQISHVSIGLFNNHGLVGERVVNFTCIQINAILRSPIIPESKRSNHIVSTTLTTISIGPNPPRKPCILSASKFPSFICYHIYLNIIRSCDSLLVSCQILELNTRLCCACDCRSTCFTGENTKRNKSRLDSKCTLAAF